MSGEYLLLGGATVRGDTAEDMLRIASDCDARAESQRGHLRLQRESFDQMRRNGGRDDGGREWPNITPGTLAISEQIALEYEEAATTWRAKAAARVASVRRW